MKRYQLILNGTIVAEYDSVKSCEKRYDSLIEKLTAEHGQDFVDVLDIRDTATDTTYMDFPLTEENECH